MNVWTMFHTVIRMCRFSSHVDNTVPHYRGPHMYGINYQLIVVLSKVFIKDIQLIIGTL